MISRGESYPEWRHALQRALLALCLTPCALPLLAQNLVPNPGFEESDSCHQAGFDEHGPLHWFSANGTPDHLQGCLPYGSPFGLPLNFFTFQLPIGGSSCAGMYTFHQNGPYEYREWIMAPLLEPLVPGQTYWCSFRANAAFGGNAEYPQIWLANDKVGMLFTMHARHWYQGDPYPTPPDHAHILYPQILADTVGWTLVSGSFVADSAYQYVMIGQFFSNALTDTLHFADPTSVFPWYPRGYTLVDAICVSASPDGCDLGQGVVEQAHAEAYVYPNPATDQLVIGHAAGSDAKVLNMLGQVVWEGKVKDDRYALHVAHWSRGGYVLQKRKRSGVQVVKFLLVE